MVRSEFVRALQNLIMEAAQEDPYIDRRNLSFEIRAGEDKGIILKIDEKHIQFANYDGKAKGVSGLKDCGGGYLTTCSDGVINY